MTEQEELLMLRALVEKQKQALAVKDKMIEGQKVQIEKQKIQIENMMQALLHARKKLLGASSEVTEQIDKQMNLFETTQELAKKLFEQQKKISVPSYTRTASQPGVRAEMLASLPKDIEEYIINPEDRCTKCEGKLKVIGKRIIRTEVEFISAKLKVKQIVQQVAKCTKCGKEGSENPKDHFQKVAVPTPIMPHSTAYLKQLEDENLKLRIENAYLKELRRLRLEEEALLKK